MRQRPGLGRAAWRGAVGYQIGVDLGTTYTAAAIARDGRVEIFPLAGRAHAIPSVIFLREDETVLTGEPATRRGLADPSRMSREFKRRVGDPTPVMLGRTPYSAEALMATLLRWVIEAATEREGSAPDRVAVTHPANWGPYKKDLLAEALRIAGVGDAITLTEPEAAAIFYASSERVEVGEKVAVYDLGGGTFDACVLEKTAEGFTILGAPEGVDRLGGIDFDEAVYTHVRLTIGDAIDRLDPDDPATLTAAARLRQECIDAKEALSSDTDVSIPVNLPNLQTEVRLTRGELEGMIRPTLGATIDALRRVLRAADVDPDELRAVLLVGGSSRIPLVGELVANELRRPVAVDTHPKHSVALGAALAAARANEPSAPMPQVVDAGSESTPPPTPLPTEPPAPAPPIAVPAPPPAPPGDRPPTRSKLALPLIGVGVAGAIVALLIATRGSSGDDGDDDTSNGNAVATATSTTVAETSDIPVEEIGRIELPFEPEDAQAGGGFLYVVGGNSLARIDRQSHELSPSTLLEDDVFHVAVGGGKVFVIGALDESLYVFDAETLEPVATHEMPDNMNHLVFGGGFLWVTGGQSGLIGGNPGPGVLWKVNPDTGEVVMEVAIGESAAEVAVAFADVYVTDPLGSAVRRVNPESGEMFTFVLSGAPFEITAGAPDLFAFDFVAEESAVWVSYEGEDETRMDRIPIAVDDPIADLTVPENPADAAYDAKGDLWVLTGNQSRALNRIEARTNEVVEAIDLGKVGNGAFSGLTGDEDGTLWLLERGGKRVRVFQPVSPGELLP